MADNHQHRGISQVMTLYERQAAHAHVAVRSMMPIHAQLEQETMAETGHILYTCIKCALTPIQIVWVKRAANSAAMVYSESITLFSVGTETGTMCP